MHYRNGRRKIVDLVRLELEKKNSEVDALSYESLYEKVSSLWGGKPSRRDFQAALDKLEEDRMLVIEKDSSDRRKVKIWSGKGRPTNLEQTLAALRTDIVNFFRKNPEYAPVYVRPSGAIRIWGNIDPNDVTREMTRMFRYSTPLVKALVEIRECEKLGKKPDETTVRKWSKQYERTVDAIAEATATEFCEAMKSKREIKPKNVIDNLAQAIQQVSP